MAWGHFRGAGPRAGCWLAAPSLPWVALVVSVDQDGKKSSVAAQPRQLYITNVSSWQLLISQVSIGTVWCGWGGGGRHCSQSMGAFHPPWTFTFRCSAPIGQAHSGTVVFFSSVLWKGVGREWWTLWCWQPAELLTDVHGICARILLCSPFTAKNPQISLRGLIQICTLILVHIIPSQRCDDQKGFSTQEVSLDYIQRPRSWSTRVIWEETIRGCYWELLSSALCCWHLTSPEPMLHLFNFFTFFETDHNTSSWACVCTQPRFKWEHRSAENRHSSAQSLPLVD